ncbi:MAG: Ktr system potassium uptake protein B [Chloroflexi bacterium ADurb.Bin344]|nr:MAG: Ktr system potassium uptake protein B [Chloroflexi bacterium ADurb.Bin344]
MKTRRKILLTNTQIIALGFFLVILAGSILLMLPISSKNGSWTPFIDALFTATSATCVTGLVVFDTFTHWTVFGQIVILTLIQVGGIGLMTIVSGAYILLNKRIGIQTRQLLMTSAGNLQLSGVVRLIKRILFGTLLFEGTGTVFLATQFCPEMGIGKGIYYAIFHSVSAFCNAGFDIMGFKGEYSSLISYQSNWIVNLTIILLIVIGGIGFYVWSDMVKNRFRFRRLSLHTQITLTTTAFLLAFGTLASLFMATTPRTAGFNTIDLTKLSEPGNLLTMILMLIGAGSGSTGGGIKVTTFAVLMLNLFFMARGYENVTIFKKRLESNSFKQAGSILCCYLLAVIAATMWICSQEIYSATDVAFECFSAIGTVGLSKGLPALMKPISKIILILLMYGGRLGGISFLMIFTRQEKERPLKRVSKRILLG